MAPIDEFMIIDSCAGFIMIAVGVVLLETRDLSSKVFPLPQKRGTRLTPRLLVELFQTPSMRLARQIARRAGRTRTVACQTVTARARTQPIH